MFSVLLPFIMIKSVELNYFLRPKAFEISWLKSKMKDLCSMDASFEVLDHFAENGWVAVWPVARLYQHLSKGGTECSLFNVAKLLPS